jgi:hypothetical protein
LLLNLSLALHALGCVACGLGLFAPFPICHYYGLPQSYSMFQVYQLFSKFTLLSLWHHNLLQQ